MSKKILTAESVCEGHPDKLCDEISDGILDACLLVDRYSKCACEVMATKGNIYVSGEITCEGTVDYDAEVKKVLERVGYDSSDFRIVTNIHQQSADIHGGVCKENGDIGAGDQGVVYGYACDDTNQLLPLPVVLANRITKLIDYARHRGLLKGIKPDGKCIVSVEYEDDNPVGIDTVVISVQHDECISECQVKLELIRLLTAQLIFNSEYGYYPKHLLINPSGRFVEGGPAADTGLTGRKLMCDTYGGLAHHGGGAFSGKDATKVDRSGAYYARFVAKNIVAAGLAQKCEVCVTYAIGKVQPTSVNIETFRTSALEDEVIKKAVMKTFDFTPRGIIDSLNLREPIFSKTTCYGHFTDQSLPYEQTDKVKELVRNIVFNKE